MINTLSGTITVADCGPGYVTLDSHGVGYHVFVVGRTNVSHDGCPIRKFYIHEHIVAAQQGPSKYDLYGFETQEERSLFRAMLKDCDRVGPSAAMKAMNVAPPAQLLQAIRLGNTKYLERAVGPKTAEQIVLGLGKYAATQAAQTLV